MLVLNWGTWFHIDDVQGYDPVQVQRYVEFIDAMNGHRQEYHERDVYPGGLDSPLLDLLGARYLLVRANVPITSDIAPLLTTFPTVYEDAEVRILENSRSFPRAWLVHDARRVGAGDALPILASGAIDPHKTALLEVSLPNLSPAVATADTAVYRRATPDRIEIAVNASASALLMLSEVWSPGWHAAIDGAPTSVYLADHVLQAVAVPEGEHVVTLMYDPPYLRLGFAAAAIAALLVMILAMVFRFHRRHVHG
ncbi:MAG: YfhO family protein [Thermomicrobiales bacterium]